MKMIEKIFGRVLNLDEVISMLASQPGLSSAEYPVHPAILNAAEIELLKSEDYVEYFMGETQCQ